MAKEATNFRKYLVEAAELDEAIDFGKKEKKHDTEIYDAEKKEKTREGKRGKVATEEKNSISEPKVVEVVKPVEEIINIGKNAQIKIVPLGQKKGLEYLVIEPPLTKEEKIILEEIKKLVIEKIEYDFETLSKKQNPEEYLSKKLTEVLNEKFKNIEPYFLEKITYYIVRDFIGLGKIDAILKDPQIEDIYCNGVNIPLYIRHKKHGSLITNVSFEELGELEKYVMIISQKCKRFVTYAEPLLDASLPDGSRVQATFSSDITSKGPTFAIRKFQKLPITPIELIKSGSVSAAMMAYFWLAVEGRVSILISGGSGTGKTSFLNAIGMFIPPDYKIVSIEDTSELNLPHQNWVKSVTRTGYGPSLEAGKRYGEVTMFDLLKASLRQRPDYVIVGEVRGEEASVLFQGMASGHSSLGTIHAESLEAVIERLTTPPINLPSNLVDLIDVVALLILATSKGPNARRVSKIIEIESVTKGEPIVRTPFLWDPFEDKFPPIETFSAELIPYESYLIEKISKETGKKKEELIAELRKRERIINWMLANDIKTFYDVFNVISEYWYSPDTVLQKIGLKDHSK